MVHNAAQRWRVCDTRRASLLYPDFSLSSPMLKTRRSFIVFSYPIDLHEIFDDGIFFFWKRLRREDRALWLCPCY